ncbi:hypothetical protein [Nitrospina watsonii]|uniref:Uncharacterized protein n=1 Tax=Nitrospina watsonii TaxID=1323948 RepID=A0ABM9HB96_9BACT|nr:hypothetical protein [Nitrospina watsonii]CAI2717408.1 protein of unknown function [Nitrospina watsonii]
MAEIDSSFPFNRLGLPRFGENNDDENNGAISRLRRAQEERAERREEDRRVNQVQDRVNATPRPQPGEVRLAEDVVRREAETAPAPRTNLEVARSVVGEVDNETGLRLDANNPDAPRPFSPIEQAIAAVIRRPGNLELRPQTNGVLGTEPGGEGAAARLLLPPEPQVLDRALPQPPEPESQVLDRALPQPPEPEPEPQDPLLLQQGNLPPVGATEPRILAQEQPDSNIEQLTENPAALRSNFLETAPALRANRELRDLLAEPDSADDETGVLQQANNNLLLSDPEPFVLPGAQLDAVTPPTAEAIGTERVEQNRIEQAEEQAEARRARREEEEEDRNETRPRPLNPETQLTRRGLNINQFI